VKGPVKEDGVTEAAELAEVTGLVEAVVGVWTITVRTEPLAGKVTVLGAVPSYPEKSVV
jgi:hypothetical protein